LTLFDGFTLSQHYDAWTQFLKEYFKERAKKGTLVEQASPTYSKYTIQSVYNIRDFASSADLNNQAENFLNLLFGFGFSASLELSGTGHFAHNDWLELLSNYGLLGVITYLALIVSVFKYALKPNIKIDNRMMIFAILAIWLITSMISMHYMSGSGYFKAMLLAYLINPQNETKKA